MNILRKLGELVLQREDECRIHASFETLQPIESVILIPKIELERSEPVDFRWYRHSPSSFKRVKAEDEDDKRLYDIPDGVTLVSRGFHYTPTVADVGHHLLFTATVKLDHESNTSTCDVLFDKVIPYPRLPPLLPIQKRQKKKIWYGRAHTNVRVASLNLMGFIYPHNACELEHDELYMLVNPNYRVFRDLDGELMSEKKRRLLFDFYRRRYSIFQEIRSRNSDIISVNHVHPDESDFLMSKMNQVGYETTGSATYRLETKSYYSDILDEIDEEVEGESDKEDEEDEEERKASIRPMTSMVFFKRNRFRLVNSFTIEMKNFLGLPKHVPRMEGSGLDLRSFMKEKKNELDKRSKYLIFDKKIQFLQLEHNQEDIFENVSVDDPRIKNIFRQVDRHDSFVVSNIYFHPDEDSKCMEYQLDLINQITDELKRKIQRPVGSFDSNDDFDDESDDDDFDDDSVIHTTSDSSVQDLTQMSYGEEDDTSQDTLTDLTTSSGLEEGGEEFTTTTTTSDLTESESDIARPAAQSTGESSGFSSSDDSDEVAGVIRTGLTSSSEEELQIEQQRRIPPKRYRRITNPIVLILGCGGERFYYDDVVGMFLHSRNMMTPKDIRFATSEQKRLEDPNIADPNLLFSYVNLRKNVHRKKHSFFKVWEDMLKLTKESEDEGGPDRIPFRWDGLDGTARFVDTFVLYEGRNDVEYWDVDGISVIHGVKDFRLGDVKWKTGHVGTLFKDLKNIECISGFTMLERLKGVDMSLSLQKETGRASYPNEFFVSESPGIQLFFNLARIVPKRKLNRKEKIMKMKKKT